MGLLDLPPEIWNAVEKHLDDNDRRELCQTCNRLMNALQKKAYRCVVLDESTESGRGISALASGPRAKFVRNIQYSPFRPMPRLGWDEDDICFDGKDRNIALSNETRSVLQSLNLFRGLKKFRIILDEWELNGWPNTPFSFSYFSFGEYHNDHDEEPWRILLEQSIQALSKSAGAFSKLEIAHLPPIPEQEPYKAFETKDWRALLQKLTSFEITLDELGDDGVGNQTVFHQDFLINFPRMFLDHLTNVEHLRIAAQEDGMIGHYNSSPFDWNLLQMPHLKTFELDYSILGRGLVSFLINHSDTLETVYLRYCLGPSTMNWVDLFEGFVKRGASRLVEFRAPQLPVPKRSLYPDDEDWRELWGKMGREMKEPELVPYDESEEEDDQEHERTDSDQAASDSATRAAILRTENANEANDKKGGVESKPNGDGDGKRVETHEDYDHNNDDRQCRTRHKKKYCDMRRPWNEVVVDERCRRFVIGETCESYGQIQPVELYWEADDGDWETDESEVVEAWEKLEELLHRNRDMAQLSK